MCAVLLMTHFARGQNVYVGKVIQPLPAGDASVAANGAAVSSNFGSSTYYLTAPLQPDGTPGTSTPFVPGPDQTAVYPGIGNGTLYGGSAGYTSGSYDATVWTSATRYTDIAPAGYSYSNVSSISPNGSQEIGSGTDSSGNSHLLLWQNSNGVLSKTPVDITPDPQTFGLMYPGLAATDGVHQVGSADDVSENYEQHAIVLTGNAAPPIDLQSTVDALGFTGGSNADGVSGSQIVGSANLPANRGGYYVHGILWTSDGKGSYTPTDLTPVGSNAASVTLTNGTVQAGSAENPLTYPLYFRDDVYAWEGTAASAVDLSSLISPIAPNGLPYNSMQATAVDANGDVFGVGTTDDPNTYALTAYEIEWVNVLGVPEPASLALLAIGGIGLLMRPSRRRA